jgi:hypothetical protein
MDWALHRTRRPPPPPPSPRPSPVADPAPFRFANEGAIRGEERRAALRGIACAHCRAFFEALPCLTADLLRQQASRHRMECGVGAGERDESPPHLWAVEQTLPSQEVRTPLGRGVVMDEV